MSRDFFTIDIKIDRQSVNFAIKNTLMSLGLEPIWVLANVTLKELDYGMKTFWQSIPIFIQNVSKQG